MARSKSPIRVTSHGEKMLEVLQKASGEWLTRRQLSDALEKSRLTPYDLDMLELLKEKGLIEMNQRSITGPIGYEWIYRATVAE